MPTYTKPDFVQLRQRAEPLVKKLSYYKKFVDGTPLENDMATMLAVFARDVLDEYIERSSSASRPA